MNNEKEIKFENYLDNEEREARDWLKSGMEEIGLQKDLIESRLALFIQFIRTIKQSSGFKKPMEIAKDYLEDIKKAKE